MEKELSLKLNLMSNLIKNYKNIMVGLSEEERLKLIKKYTLSDGTLFSMKMLCDLSMWTNFAEEYGIDKVGIKKLREILGPADKFKKKIGIKK